MTRKPTRKLTADDCRSCGACCGPTFDQDVYVDLTGDDLVQLGKSKRTLAMVAETRPLMNAFAQFTQSLGALLTSTNEPYFALKTKRTRSNGVTCVALSGKIGQSVSCSIYAVRPEACRKFEVGSDHCLAARKHLEIE